MTTRVEGYAYFQVSGNMGEPLELRAVNDILESGEDKSHRTYTLTPDGEQLVIAQDKGRTIYVATIGDPNVKINDRDVKSTYLTVKQRNPVEITATVEKSAARLHITNAVE